MLVTSLLFMPICSSVEVDNKKNFIEMLTPKTTYTTIKIESNIEKVDFFKVYADKYVNKQTSTSISSLTEIEIKLTSHMNEEEYAFIEDINVPLPIKRQIMVNAKISKVAKFTPSPFFD